MSLASRKEDSSPMNSQGYKHPINRRRYQRYEIDTQLQVTVLGVEQRAIVLRDVKGYLPPSKLTREQARTRTTLQWQTQT